MDSYIRKLRIPQKYTSNTHTETQKSSILQPQICLRIPVVVMKNVFIRKPHTLKTMPVYLLIKTVLKTDQK